MRTDPTGKSAAVRALEEDIQPGAEPRRDETPYMTVERIDDAANNGNAAARRLAGGGS
ncbi:hypothetical protein [Streptomyces broussonetiae]|uniref:Uncharacterized protein n=1 Tax=Streptomyces broussonetiae TaxID=2686304 RepID=A0ABV5EFH9_9ACTN